MNKKEIRKISIQKRKKINNNYLNFVSNLIIKKIINKFNLINKNIGIYFPINNEINPIYILNLEKINLYFPIIYKNKIVFSQIQKNSKELIQKFRKNNFNYSTNKHNYKLIPELIYENNIIQSKFITNNLIPEIIIVPLIGFNTQCFRIGYGSGYYDQYFKNKKIIKIGVGLDLQKYEFHVEQHDIALDYIFTEKRIYNKICKKLF